jgi:iron complex outermembrane receptor protein
MLGADNMFDVYPDKNSVGNALVGGNSNFGIFPYNGISPFGFNGRFAYVRATWNY